MEIQKLDKTLAKYGVELSLKLREEFAVLCFKETMPVGSLLLKPKHPDQFEYTLLDCIVRTFLLNTKGEEITLSFFEHNTILPSHVTRTENGKSLLYCEPLTECIFLQDQWTMEKISKSFRC